MNKLLYTARCFFAALFFATVLLACKLPSTFSGVSDTGWEAHGLNHQETRYSELDLINRENVNDLGLAWYVDLPGNSGQEATPLIVDGVMYTTSAWNHVFALNPVTGEQLWHYDPQVDKSVAAKGCCGPVNRGAAHANGKIFVGLFDGRLIALDARKGTLLWGVQTVDTQKNYTITGAPRVVDGKVIIGNGGAEFGVRGYVSAYDENTGKMIWRFYTAPGDPSKPQENPIHNQTVETWSGEFWKLGGGATVWDSMAYDPELNLLYVGTGNGGPWNPSARTGGEGDNLFVSSIVALDVDTGHYQWHYQTTPQDGWDYTATQHMILADLEIDGQLRKVIMQAPKNGFFYVLDRRTGAFISAENYVPVTWAERIDKKGRPVINPEAKYWETGEPALVAPAWSGGHNWHPMSYSRKTGLVYIPANEMAFPYVQDKSLDIHNPSRLAFNYGVDVLPATFPDDPKMIEFIKASNKGHLAAWDPVQQREVWRVQYSGPWNGGVLSTAGDLVFQGTAAGFINAYDASSGEQLWQHPAQTGIVAPPVTYAIDGEQYVTVSAGWGGAFARSTGPLTQIATANPINRSRLLTFKLNGASQLPEPVALMKQLPDLSMLDYQESLAKAGHRDYERYCTHCHGSGAVGGGVVTDLRYSEAIANKETFYAIVGGGALRDRGMVGFDTELSPERIDAIRHFVIGRNKFAHSIGDKQRLSR